MTPTRHTVVAGGRSGATQGTTVATDWCAQLHRGHAGARDGPSGGAIPTTNTPAARLGGGTAAVHRGATRRRTADRTVDAPAGTAAITSGRTQMNPRRLYRSQDRMLAGVAGGMAEYLDLDPTIVRISWIVVGLASAGMALIAYILLAIVIPARPYPAASGTWGSPPASGTWPGPASAPGGAWPPSAGGPGTGAGWPDPGGGHGDAWASPPAAPAWPAQASAWAPQPATRPASRGLGAAAVVGVVLVVIGAIALADAALPGLRAGILLGPAVLITLGAALLAASIRRPADASPAVAPAPAATSPAGGGPAAPPEPTPWPASGASPSDAPAEMPADVSAGGEPGGA